MNLAPEERETIILFSDADTEANVYTHDAKLIARLEKLARQYPDQYYVERREHPGAVSYNVPKGCIQIRAPHSQNQRKAARKWALEHGFNAKPASSDS